MSCIMEFYVVIKVCILLINSAKIKNMNSTQQLDYYWCLIASPVEEGVVYLEGDVVVVVCVASKQKGARVTVKRVADKSHGAGHCRHNNLR